MGRVKGARGGTDQTAVSSSAGFPSGSKSAPLCSIVVPVWNRLDLTQRCLVALGRAQTRVSFEVIVVDNGSTDGTWAFLEAAGDQLRLLRNGVNLGFSRACNQGARAARGRFVVFLNNDTEPREGWLDALVETAEGDPRVGVVGSRLLYPDGRVQHAGVVLSRRGLVPYNLYRGAEGTLPEAQQYRELRAVSGACMLVRRDAFHQVGGFDEGFRNGFEDVDLCLKIHVGGSRILVDPRSEVVHMEGQTEGRSDAEESNLERFRARWSERVFPDEDWVLVADGKVARMRVSNGRVEHSVLELDDPEERHQWKRVAALQRDLYQAGLEAAEPYLEDPNGWPADAEALLWACELCRRLSLLDLEHDFKRRVAALVVDAPTASTQRPGENDELLGRACLALRTLI